MTRKTTTDCSNLNHRLIAYRVLHQRDTLRDTPPAITTACELARHLLADFTGLDADDRPSYATPCQIDALIAVIGAASAHLTQTAYDLVGEDDSDLPTIEPPAPRPAVEVSPADQRAVWERLAAQAAEELAKLADDQEGGE